MIVFLTYACKNNFKILHDVVRYLSTCSPEDDIFDSTNSLRQPINEHQLQSIVKIIENKLSVGLLEKRRKYFSDHEPHKPIKDKTPSITAKGSD